MKIEGTNFFKTIHLEEMGRVKLMKRTDKKFWFHASLLQNLLSEIQENYFILKMNGKVALPYSTVYYDTANNNMYTTHHNGKLNRYKIRRRSYIMSGISFLEVKFKNNKGRTIKNRIPCECDQYDFTEQEKNFLIEFTPFSGEDLKPALINNFRRITLVNKNFSERCTIDINLKFGIKGKQVSLVNLVVVEIKTDGAPSGSPLSKALQNIHINSSGFSKYCIGRITTDDSLKNNAFKHKLRRIEKTMYSGKKLQTIN